MNRSFTSASLNSASNRARLFVAAMFFGTASLLVGCGEPTNPAADYLATADSGSTTNTPTDPPAATTGDATNGKKLLETCTAACHGTTKPGPVATMTILNKAVISKLSVAITGANKATHTGYQTTHFEGQPRKDLEAALELIP